MKKFLLTFLFTLLVFVSTSCQPISPKNKEYDLVIYGGTAGGLISAISAAREGASVVILEPTSHVGGMVTGGLGRTDIGISSTIGGMSAEFYRRVRKQYDDPASWKFQTREEYLADERTRSRLNGEEWWFHEPSVASKIFDEMLQEVDLSVLTNHRLESLEKQGNRITSLRCENGSTFEGRVYIDATYEGDLLASAGVSYHVGRESSAQYGEKFAGVLPWEFSTRKQWDVDISPYDKNGSPSKSQNGHQ